MLTAMRSCEKWGIWKLPIRTHLWQKKQKQKEGNLIQGICTISVNRDQLSHLELKTCQDVEAGSWPSESTQTSSGLQFQLSTKMWMVDFFLMRKMLLSLLLKDHLSARESFPTKGW